MTLRNASLVERVRAAGVAGFAAIGWRFDDILAAREAGLYQGDIEQLFRISGVRPVEVEFFREWIGKDKQTSYLRRETELFSLAQCLDARHVNVAVFDNVPKAKLTTAFAALCRRAAAYNLIVQLEFMPYTPPVHSLKDAWDVVRAADEPNAGLLIDAWHWGRTSGCLEALAEVPAEKITCIQLGDVLAVPLAEVTEESRHYRCVPGGGSMDLPHFLHIFQEHGVNAPLSVEVMSDRLDALPPTVAAYEVARGVRSVLWDALWQTSIRRSSAETAEPPSGKRKSGQIKGGDVAAVS